MPENFEDYSKSYMEFIFDHEKFKRILSNQEKETNIRYANIYLKHHLNFDLFKVYTNLMEFTRKIWSKLVYVSFDKIEFEKLNKFFNTYITKINTNNIENLKNKINQLENDNDILKLELEKLFNGKEKGRKTSEQINLILSQSQKRYKKIIENCVDQNKNKSVNLNFSLRSSSMKKINSNKNFFMRTKNFEGKNNKENEQEKILRKSKSKLLSISSDKNLSIFEEGNISFIDKKYFSPLSIANDINNVKGAYFNNNKKGD
jgi:hypothetical protein